MWCRPAQLLAHPLARGIEARHQLATLYRETRRIPQAEAPWRTITESEGQQIVVGIAVAVLHAGLEL